MSNVSWSFMEPDDFLEQVALSRESETLFLRMLLLNFWCAISKYVSVKCEFEMSDLEKGNKLFADD